MIQHISSSHLLDNQAFEAIRSEKFKDIIAIKKKRNLAVGPFAVFHFECFDTLWWQIQEMVRIEKGGYAQQLEEIEIYQPLLPQGSDWRATFMLEIPDASQRREILKQLGHIEEAIFLHLDDTVIQPTSINPEEERTTTHGKTSAVHFLKFEFSSEVRKKILTNGNHISLRIEHPLYRHESVISSVILSELRRDLTP